MGEVALEEPFITRPGASGRDRGKRRSMTLLSFVIRPESLEAVKQALDQLNVGGMTVTDVRGFGRQKGQVEHYRGGEYTIRLLPKIRIEAALKQEDVERAMAAIAAAARTGQVGDGKVFAAELHNVMRVRTGERGVSAL